MLVGAGTARAENYGPVRLTEAQQAARHLQGRTTPPPIAVMSRTGDLPSRLFSPEQTPILVTSAQAAAQRNLTGDRRWKVLVAGDESVDVTRAVALLREQGMHRVLCEGGPTLLDELVDADAVTENCVHSGPQTRREPTRWPPGGAVAAAPSDLDAARARTGLRRLPVPQIPTLSTTVRASRVRATQVTCS